MFPLSFEEIKHLKIENIELLCKLDDNGFFAKVNESFEDFRGRLMSEYEHIEKFTESINGESSIKLFDDIEVSKSDLIDNSIILEAIEETKKLYDFQIDYLPGFFLSKDIGLLWGGCSIYDEETSQRIFLIRKSFKSQKRWFIYDRSELLAHELCHSARQILLDHSLEEYFAYQTSESKFRRYMGNCFISDFDAILFVFPALLMLGVQIVNSYFWDKLWVWPFWLLTIGVFFFFIIRNYLARALISTAEKKLKAWNIKKINGLLFRCTREEIAEIIKLKSEEEFKGYLNLKAREEIRFKVILKKWQIND